jgi:hypothetical protein
MPNIIAFEDNSPGSSEDDLIFVNADTITHWAARRSKQGGTAIHFIGGGSLMVSEDIWDVACMIDPPERGPQVISASRRITEGDVIPGTPITIESVLTFEDGTTETTIHRTIFDKIEYNDYTKKHSYRCLGGSMNGQQPDDGARWGFDLDEFDSEVTA